MSDGYVELLLASIWVQKSSIIKLLKSKKKKKSQKNQKLSLVVNAIISFLVLQLFKTTNFDKSVIFLKKSPIQNLWLE